MPFMETPPPRFNPLPMLVALLALAATAMLGSVFRPDRETLTLGIAALGFAGMQVMIHQWRTQSEERDRYLKRQYDLFERRWKIYAGVREFIDAMLPPRSASVAGVKAAEMFKTDPELRLARGTIQTMGVNVLTLVLAQQSLSALMVEAHFLFRADVNEYMEELNKRCDALLEIESKQAPASHSGDPESTTPSTTPSSLTVSDWFSKQDPIVRQKFESYLRLS